MIAGWVSTVVYRKIDIWIEIKIESDSVSNSVYN